MMHDDEFGTGQTVYHKTLGKGRVVWVAVGEFGADIQVDFEAHGRKRLVLAFARSHLSLEPWPT